MRRPSMPSLLWSALSGLDRAHAERGAGVGGMPSLPQWANCLRAIDARGGRRSDLARLLRLSKRAVRSNLLDASRNGWVGEENAPDRSVRLTGAGSDVAARWPSLRDAAENDWVGSSGIGTARYLRGALDTFVSRLPLELSHYPAGYGMADRRVTGGDGSDWHPVRRDAGDSVERLPLSALVSQALVAFAMEYEERSGVALSSSAIVRTAIRSEGRPAKELGPRPAVSALTRHGFLRVTISERGPVMFVTVRGREIVDAHDGLVAEIEADWRACFGEATVAGLRDALVGLADASGDASPLDDPRTHERQSRT